MKKNNKNDFWQKLFFGIAIITLPMAWIEIKLTGGIWLDWLVFILTAIYIPFFILDKL